VGLDTNAQAPAEVHGELVACITRMGVRDALAGTAALAARDLEHALAVVLPPTTTAGAEAAEAAVVVVDPVLDAPRDHGVEDPIGAQVVERVLEGRRATEPHGR